MLLFNSWKTVLPQSYVQIGVHSAVCRTTFSFIEISYLPSTVLNQRHEPN